MINPPQGELLLNSNPPIGGITIRPDVK